MSALVACGDSKSTTSAPPDDASRPRRVFEPPPGEVRPVPPFAIRADGIGPYLLGADIKEVLDLVPRGPRIELLKIEDVAEADLVRTEDGALVVGGDGRAVSFAAVVRPEIAKTASGVGVGSTAAELDEAFSDPIAPSHRASDPRVREFTSLPGARFIMERDGRERVIAVMVAAREVSEDPVPPDVVACRSGGELAASEDEIIEAGRLDAKRSRIAFGCFTGPDPQALVFDDERVAVVDGAPGRLRRVTVHRRAPLRYAAPIDLDGDGRDEIAEVSIEKRKNELESEVELVRWDGAKLAAIHSERAYSITAAAAALAGATVDDIELFVEVDAAGGGLVIGGVYAYRGRKGIRDVVPLVPREVRRRK